MANQRTILHPTDFSESSDKAFQVACSLARDRAAQLLVLHVVPPPLATLGGTQAIPPVVEEFDLQTPRKLLAAIKEPPGVTMLTRLEVGDETDIIVEVANEIGPEMIVMGTHGRTGLNRLLMGSVAEHVVRRAECPVLTLKAESALK
jgi:nucleotide-binding universal stress UspA family protein